MILQVLGEINRCVECLDGEAGVEGVHVHQLAAHALRRAGGGPAHLTAHLKVKKKKFNIISGK